MKKTISATIDKNLAKWIDKELRNNLNFRNKSHFIEKALIVMKEKLEKEKP